MLSKKLLVLASVVVGQLSMNQVLAGEKVDQSVETQLGDVVRIEHVRGNVEITGWDKNEVYVKGELDDRAEDFIFERGRKGVEVKVVTPRKKCWSCDRNSEGDQLVIKVPHSSLVRYDTVNADVEITDLQEGLDAETVNGDMQIKAVTGRIRLESVNGDIEAKDINGDSRVETVNGNIDISDSVLENVLLNSVNGDMFVEASAPELSLESVNGKVELIVPEVKEMELVTVNGKMEASIGALAKGAEVEVSSVSGKVTLKLPEQTSAQFDIESHAGGRIKNELTKDKVKKAKYGPNRSLSFVMGEGSAEVEVSTVSGKVTLEKVE